MALLVAGQGVIVKRPRTRRIASRMMPCRTLLRAHNDRDLRRIRRGSTKRRQVARSFHFTIAFEHDFARRAVAHPGLIAAKRLHAEFLPVAEPPNSPMDVEDAFACAMLSARPRRGSCKA
jgi:hypothetical protein